jgi:2-oxoglutarate dehydrogenase E1 component
MRDDQKLLYAGRAASAAPASGYAARHAETQKALVEQAFGKYK